MSRPGTITQSPSYTAWWKHLRAFGKRAASKMDRKAAARDAQSRATSALRPGGKAEPGERDA